MKTSDFDYFLPRERIAQSPVEPRDSSRLLVMDRRQDAIEHTKFRELDRYLHKNDVIVINRTRVIPARIFGKKVSGGRVEILLLSKKESTVWEALIGGKKLSIGSEIELQEDLRAVIVSEMEGSRRLVQFSKPVESYLQFNGEMPLPPYIHTRLTDQERYQTVYSKDEGSAAAPTAGLHFTPELIVKLKEKGIVFAEIILHVGLDTFAPVHEDEPEKHQIHSEWCEINDDNAQIVNQAKKEGSRIVAVGTTTVRTLESAVANSTSGNVVAAFQGPTRLFILPGYQFKVVDAMVTNFHLPKSTLLMLVSAFAGKDRIFAAYREAIDNQYRFFSFGDAMLIL